MKKSIQKAEESESDDDDDDDDDDDLLSTYDAHPSTYVASAKAIKASSSKLDRGR